MVLTCAHEFADELDKASYLELFHNIRAVKLYGPRAYAEPPAAFLAGGSPNDVSQNSAFAR
jgi:hypothetical protein